MRTRFAPSPSGPLHVGHVLAAVEARDYAQRGGGECLLRIEDIDARCKPEWVELMERDLRWLGLTFDGDVLWQSRSFDRYAAALARLREGGFLYPCFCTRAEIRTQMLESGRAPHEELGFQYEGQCRALPPELVEQRLSRGEAHAWRLDMRRAEDELGVLSWVDELQGEQCVVPSAWGDPVLARKEFPASYHLCVVVDDAMQQISHVTRGLDLSSSTHLHRVIQGLLGLPTPLYRHHGLICDAQGKRLAKRDGARSLVSLREAGFTAQQLLDSLQRALENGGIWSL